MTINTHVQFRSFLFSFFLLSYHLLPSLVPHAIELCYPQLFGLG